MQRNRQSQWLQEWSDFGVNKIAMDPVYHESYFQNHFNFCFKHNIVECFHTPCKTVKDLEDIPEHTILDEFMSRHHEWLIMTNIKHQYVLNKLMIVRPI